MSKRRAVTQLPHLGEIVSTFANLFNSERRALDSCCHQSDLGLCKRRAEHLLRGRIN